MSSTMEFTGNDVPQAIAKACEKLNVKQDQLDIEVVSPGSNGIFGMFGRKKACIAVSLKGQAKGRKNDRKKTPPQDRNNGGKKSGRPPRKTEEKTPADISPSHLDKVKSDLEQILSLMGFPGKAEVSCEGNRIRGHISGEHIEEITGAEGQVLDSIQYLMRKIISRMVEGKVLFSLDAGDYRQQRRQDLEARALELAEEVRTTGRTRSIPAINPAERRIVHMALQDDTTIRSRSIGEGHFKKILIYLPGQGRRKKH
ncbi:MAG: Jag N-terminal domain-containing protein [Proteobacteria bacterium]|nr:Jag N-terminal domain-containing protein [Pseudomonadota bacterium]MBU1737468.1 Jag N-terminal domain-containing protein [Pseudomonadota bacterium]